MKVRNFSTIGADGGAGTFIDLPDTPAEYTGANGQALAVNGTGDGIEFYTRHIVYNFWAGGLVIYDNELLSQVVVTEGMTVKSGGVGAYAYANTAPTGSVTLDLLKNGVSFGSVTFSAASNTGTINIPSDTTFSNSDRLSLQYVGTPDTTVADLTVSLRGDLI